ncbi:MAG: HAD-IIIC family phosphatase [Rhodospirillaceae bacterium]|nr:HAD-IIIC family phosphatase [Rhodospirillaceae bacterium]
MASSASGLREALLKAAGPPGRPLVIHSSLAAFKPPQPPTTGDLAAILRGLLDEGHTLALPTFTFSFLRDGHYDWTLPGETSVLSETARSMLAFRRTENPVYSYAVAGPQRAALEDGQNTDLFGDGSILDRFDQAGALILLAGCGLRYCTQIHRYEAIAQVPYRYMKHFKGHADYGSGAQPVGVDMYVRDLDINAENDFSQVEQRLTDEGGMARFNAWSGEILAIDTVRLRQICLELLRHDPFSLTSDPVGVAARVRHAAVRSREKPLRVALCGHATLQPLAEAFAAEVTPYLPDRHIETHVLPFGQLLAELGRADSALGRFDADFTVFADRAEDLIGEPRLYVEDGERLRDAVGRYCSAIAAHRTIARGWFVVCGFAGPTPDAPAGPPMAALVAALNEQLQRTVAELDDAMVLSPAEVASAAGAKLCDDRLWFLGRFPFSHAFSKAMAQHLAGCALAAFGRTIRLVAVDLDNTLWGGILGEDGADALAVGGDYPGNAFRAFQRCLKTLSERGIALAVLSKNDEAPALEALDSLPGMVVRSSDFVAHSINWSPKWRGLQAILDDLSLGQASVLFLDDNPVERAQMRRHLPEVHVLDLPDDPAERVAALEACPLLAALTLTETDLRRVEAYRSRAHLKTVQAEATDESTFLSQLRPRLTIAALDRLNATRVVQLIQKTNQFNTTTRRYTRQDLDAIAESSGAVYALGVEDRFNAYEILGVLVLTRDAGETVIDNYVLSCRVLGRGVETEVVLWAMRQAKAHGDGRVVGRIVETPRNTPCRDIFQRCGFTEGADGTWVFNLDSTVPGPAGYIEICEPTPPPGDGRTLPAAADATRTNP